MTEVARASRVVAIHERTVEGIRNELAKMNLVVAELEAAWHEAENAYKKACEEPLQIAHIDDLESSSGHLRHLRQNADIVLLRLTHARAAAEEKRSELIAAQTELKKLQMWRDQWASKAETEEARKERKLTDDLASRRAMK